MRAAHDRICCFGPGSRMSSALLNHSGGTTASGLPGSDAIFQSLHPARACSKSRSPWVHFACLQVQANAVSWQSHQYCYTAGAPDMNAPHRKRVRSYNLSGHAHELTFSCFRRLPLLSRDRTRRWLMDALDNARRDLDLALWGRKGVGSRFNRLPTIFSPFSPSWTVLSRRLAHLEARNRFAVFVDEAKTAFPVHFL